MFGLVLWCVSSQCSNFSNSWLSETFLTSSSPSHYFGAVPSHDSECCFQLAQQSVAHHYDVEQREWNFFGFTFPSISSVWHLWQTHSQQSRFLAVCGAQRKRVQEVRKEQLVSDVLQWCQGTVSLPGAVGNCLCQEPHRIFMEFRYMCKHWTEQPWIVTWTPE